MAELEKAKRYPTDGHTNVPTQSPIKKNMNFIFSSRDEATIGYYVCRSVCLSFVRNFFLAFRPTRCNKEERATRRMKNGKLKNDVRTHLKSVQKSSIPPTTYIFLGRNLM